MWSAISTGLIERTSGFIYQICHHQEFEKELGEKLVIDTRITLVKMVPGYLLVELRPWRLTEAKLELALRCA